MYIEQANMQYLTKTKNRGMVKRAFDQAKCWAEHLLFDLRTDLQK
jgi:hypothetical protein